MKYVWRLLAVGWLPASIVLTAIALIHVFNHFYPDAVHWAPIVAGPVDAYGTFVGGLFKPVHDAVLQHASFGLPAWSADVATAYTASATACAMAGTSFTKREGLIENAQSSAASLGWPLAILVFAFNAVRKRVVTRFAAEHTALFSLYVLAVAGVIAAAFYADKLLALRGA